MKKFTTMIAIIIVCLVFAGCTSDVSSAAVIPETTKATEETFSDIPGAKEFHEIDWPTFGAATKIPVPDWSTWGTILIDSETSFWVQIGYSTLDNYNAYVEACKEMGYVEDYYNVAGYMYYGANADGYAVQLTYNEYDHYVGIQVTHDAASWNKYWLDEN